MIFHADTHSYYNGDEKYLGVTSTIGKMKQPTDWDQIAENYVNKKTRRELLEDLAKKWKITFRQAREKWGNEEFTGPWIRTVWKDKSERALAGGSFFHDWKEIQDSDTCFYNPVVNNKKTLLDLNELTDGTYLELGVYAHQYYTCGQVDKIKFEGKYFDISDYKTDAEKPSTETKAYWNSNTGRSEVKKFISPLSHIPETNYYKHALQMSTYSRMLELYKGYKCRSLTVKYVHTEYRHPLQAGDDLVIHEEPEFDRVRVFLGLEDIELPYLKKEAEAILKYNRNAYRQKNR